MQWFWAPKLQKAITKAIISNFIHDSLKNHKHEKEKNREF